MLQLVRIVLDFIERILSILEQRFIQWGWVFLIGAMIFSIFYLT